ncbi:uncharacterized protein A1O5_03254 [Cladophialophora psammophila CBS 110553]|uniref:C3H1-type domain-containing protein n=1 Tax=Cladophialophora psammophila CBS 110553 TaxID=1182543 RepID=W9WZY2_9EURO|nr:uncharacterized protein A1O5_03254 [Cladophialophora psammophila CBS 110553]EXJ73493.1 hypothetical protein A1O5_03254 [Cladophialophora psammophila CBS 110553]
MVICKYFLQGNCKFGSSCRNEHPGGGGFASQNRFGALSGNRFAGGSGGSPRRDAWQFNPDDIPHDLGAGKGRPKWILSAYGPGKNPPASLLVENEFSSEEVRVRFYDLASKGKETEADQEAIALWNKAEQGINQILSNARDVEKFVLEAEKKRPNRDDFTQMDGTKSRDQFIKEIESQSSSSSPFGGGTSGGFGQGSASSPFAKPAASSFGQPTQPSAFGSSPFGKPAFGQSGFGSGGSTSSPFGQPSTGGGFGSSSSPFAKPAFGSPGFGQPAFGQASQPTSTFGQPSQPTSTFGQPPPTTSAFGQPSQPSSAFGQPAFGSSGFGSTPQKNPFAPASASSGFGQASSPFGQPSQPGSTFGQPSQPTSTFGQPSQSPSTFGQATQPSSTFGQPSQPSSAFGQPSQPASAFGQPSAFGKPAFGQASSTFGQSPQTVSGFGQASTSTTSPFGQAASPSAGFGQTTAPAFGQTSLGPGSISGFGQTTSVNPFAPKPAEAQTKDENMETTTPAPSRPESRANPFAPSTIPPPAVPSQGPSVAKPIINTSKIPHPLTNRPPHALHYTQTLPLQPTQKDVSGRLTFYRGQRVEYINSTPCYRRPDGQGMEKIWFPDAGATPDVVALNKEDKIEDCEGTKEEYTDEVMGRYRYLFEEGKFRDGKIPLVPPLREWGIYDF